MTKNWRALPRKTSPTLIFSPKSPDRNFEIAILFNIVEKHNKYVFRDDLIPPQSLREGLQVINFDRCLHIVLVIGKCTDVFRGIFLVWGGEDLFIENFVMGEENFNEGDAGFSSII